jgi:hypothetical protein
VWTRLHRGIVKNPHYHIEKAGKLLAPASALLKTIIIALGEEIEQVLADRRESNPSLKGEMDTGMGRV